MRVSGNCEGSGSDYWVVHRLNQAFVTLGIDTSFELVWVCEDNRDKQVWLANVIPNGWASNKNE